MTGLSGAGKTTLAHAVQEQLTALGHAVDIIDGDVYRQTLCKDLGFSKADRLENIRRLGTVGLDKIDKGIIVILAVINPYEEARALLAAQSSRVKTVYIQCTLSVLKERDTKGLYKRALLPTDDPAHVAHFTGISDPYDIPQKPDLVIDTTLESIETASERLTTAVLGWLGTNY